MDHKLPRITFLTCLSASLGIYYSRSTTIDDEVVIIFFNSFLKLVAFVQNKPRPSFVSLHRIASIAQKRRASQSNCRCTNGPENELKGELKSPEVAWFVCQSSSKEKLSFRLHFPIERIMHLPNRKSLYAAL